MSIELLCRGSPLELSPILGVLAVVCTGISVQQPRWLANSPERHPHSHQPKSLNETLCIAAVTPKTSASDA